MGSTGRMMTNAVSAHDEILRTRPISAKGMQVIIVNGKEIETNLGDYSYPKYDRDSTSLPRGYEKFMEYSKLV